MKQRADPALVASQAFLMRFGENCGRRLEAILPEIGLTLHYRDARSYEGALLRFQGIPRGYIVLSTHVRENSRRRFTLAHEVGHYVLPDQQELCQPCTKMQVESWDDDLSKPEIAANRFSAEILMPRSLVRLEEMPTFESIEELARTCDTSLTASASRLAELSSFRIAAVWSQGGRVRWYKGSQEFYRWVRKGPLDPASFAYDAFQGLSVPNSLESVPASAWLFNKGLLEDARILEHSRYLPTYNAVLSWLAIPERIEDWDEAEKDAFGLDPEEFTLYRKRWPGRR